MKIVALEGSGAEHCQVIRFMEVQTVVILMAAVMTEGIHVFTVTQTDIQSLDEKRVILKKNLELGQGF